MVRVRLGRYTPEVRVVALSRWLIRRLAPHQIVFLSLKTTIQEIIPKLNVRQTAKLFLNGVSIIVFCCGREASRADFMCFICSSACNSLLPFVKPILWRTSSLDRFPASLSDGQGSRVKGATLATEPDVRAQLKVFCDKNKNSGCLQG